MLMKSIGTAATLAILAMGSQAMATTLTIDSFSSAQWVQDGPTTDNPNASAVADGSVLGGYRSLSVTNTKADGDNTAATEMRVTGGNLKFSNVAGARGTGSLTYDGDSDPTSVNTTGLGGANLVIGLNPYFLFTEAATVKFDNFAFFKVTAWDMTGKIATYEEELTPAYDPKLYFSQFTADAGFSFANLGALQFMISSDDTADSVDGAISAIEVYATPVPVPAAGLLLLGGMGGLTFMARRKKA